MRLHLVSRVMLVSLAAVAVLAPAPARAGAPTDQLKSSVEQIVRVLEDPSLRPEARARERRAAIRKEAEVVFDFSETAKRALGRHWQGLSEKDRQEFTSLFTDLIERAYISKIERYSGERIAYAGEAVDGALATVRTRFVTKQGTEIPVDYRMQQRGERWLVYDVSVEGVSLINNYRTQFDKIIQTSSYAELLRKMKAAEVGASASPRS
ncbi:MAG TPA: ABC transporter substrate-binding protein [Methylomirabilota bacterium]|jgi:phospholipid transport system substrate-binding protein